MALKKKLLITCDDFGMSHGINIGIVKVLTEGVGGLASIIAPAPAFDEAIAFTQEYNLKIGVHLCLTCEWDAVRWEPLTLAPSLRAPDGCFYSSWEALSKTAVDHDILTELRAQIERVKRCGIEPTYLDSHMMLWCSEGYFLSRVRNLIRRISREVGLPYISDNCNRERPRYFSGEWSVSEQGRREALAQLAVWQNSGIYHWITHPASDTEDVNALCSLEHPQREWARSYRLLDLSFLLAPETRRCIDSNGFEPVSDVDLKRLGGGVTVAICCYNGGARLRTLIETVCRQICYCQVALPCEIIIVDNNSTDDSISIVQELADLMVVPIRLIRERNQGIVFARNSAIEASRERDYLLFLDVDEIPVEEWLSAALHALVHDNADCVGGPIAVRFENCTRPAWLSDELMPFLGELCYGDDAFWINSDKTPLWTGNIGYRLSVFDKGLQFDLRYNRKKNEAGGGEDDVMFRYLLCRRARLRYIPDMRIRHYVTHRKIKRSYFLRQHYVSGRLYGKVQLPAIGHLFVENAVALGHQLLNKLLSSLRAYFYRDTRRLRIAMDAAHHAGTIVGRMQRQWEFVKRTLLCT